MLINYVVGYEDADKVNTSTVGRSKDRLKLN